MKKDTDRVNVLIRMRTDRNEGKQKRWIIEREKSGINK